jgi:SAM-dependent methyltransferase
MTERLQLGLLAVSFEGGMRLQTQFDIHAGVLFDLDFQLRIVNEGSGEEVYSTSIRQQGKDIAWLPRGQYHLEILITDAFLPQGDYQLQLSIWSKTNAMPVLEDDCSCTLSCDAADSGNNEAPSWQLRALQGTIPIHNLSWGRGHEDWFFRHFDHAARVIINMILGNSELLRGRILDVGCGDGIIDLGIFHRCQPELLVGIDPFRGYERLPEIVEQNHLPVSLLDDERLQFRADDGNAIDFPDDSFDVVLSWGSLEHIAGGYAGTLREIRRVLKPDGLFFVHPGLYYGPLGNHLGEFFEDPWIHLQTEPDELKKQVLSTKPEYMDRSGEESSQEQYWQWYTELNKVDVAGFEKEIRDMGFEPWRVALRHNNMVEYTPGLQKYSFQDLATAELYLSAYNRK